LITRVKVFLVFIILTLGSLASVQAAAPKAGAKCAKVGKIKESNGKEFKCVKKSGKLVWKLNSKGALAPSPTPSITPSPTTSVSVSPAPTPVEEPISLVARDGARCASQDEKQVLKDRTYSCIKEDSKLKWKEIERDFDFIFSTDDGYLYEYTGPCQYENSTPSHWRDFQDYYISFQQCSGQLQLRQYQLGNQRPTNELTQRSSMQQVDSCKIVEPDSSKNLRGFINKNDEGRTRWFNNSKFPAPSTTIQVVPFQALDSSPSRKSPSEDYKIFLDYVKNWINYSSDNSADAKINVHPEYIKTNFNLSQYKLDHKNHHSDTNHQAFRIEMMKIADPLIDFSKADHVLFLTTPGTPIELFQQGALGPFQTNEKYIWHSSTQFPYTLENPSKVRFANLAHPFWWIHEFYHAGVGLDDHYGDQQRNVQTEYGLGFWSLMTPWGGDLTAWEKWFLGFISDEQVRCAPIDKSTTHWLAPSSVKSTSNKLFVLPLNKHKAIVAESIRPAGLYYKISKDSAGVLLYVVDLEISGHGYGLKVVPPVGRNPNPRPNDLFMTEATLRLGESVLTNGYQITVVETGNFGDVIKVEPQK